MEHRWSTRKPHQCSVIVDNTHHGRVAVRLCNIGMGGVFVESGEITLPLNAPVHVVLTLGRENDRRDFRLPAMVVRHHPNGAGIMFLETDGATLRALRNALYESLPPSGAARTRRADTRAPIERAAVSGR